MINVTEISKSYNKRPNDWLLLPSTKRIIKRLLGDTGRMTSDLIITTNGGTLGGGKTLIHEDLLSEYNRWLQNSKERNHNYQTYIFYDSTNMCYKIGKSIDYIKRHRALCFNNPNIEILLVINDNIENYLHQKYEIYRMHGEWFNLTKKDINRIKKEFNNKIHYESKNR